MPKQAFLKASTSRERLDHTGNDPEEPDSTPDSSTSAAATVEPQLKSPAKKAGRYLLVFISGILVMQGYKMSTLTTLQIGLAIQTALDLPANNVTGEIQTDTLKRTTTNHVTTRQIIEPARNNSDGACPLKQIPQVPRTWTWKMNEQAYLWPSLYQPCLRFQCSKDHTRCDTLEATNYDGPTPPCCVHILRDLAQAFDAMMCEFGLEYFVTYGMLLGLHRSDRLIPWTIDNDYIATRSTIQYLMTAKENSAQQAVFAKHGLYLVQDNFFRVCPAHTFAGGQLAAKWTNTTSKGWYPLLHQYSDIFVADVDSTGQHMLDELKCSHDLADHTLRRQAIYNGSFHVSFPNHPEAVVAGVYGTNWRTPDAKKSEHGNTKCIPKPGLSW